MLTTIENRIRTTVMVTFLISVMTYLSVSAATGTTLGAILSGAVYLAALHLSLWISTKLLNFQNQPDKASTPVLLINSCETQANPLSRSTYAHAESGGENYKINIGFKSMSEMHDAHDFLCDLIKAPPKSNIDYRCVLSCGCKSSYGGFPSYWDATDRDGSLAVASGVLCEKCFHVFEARPAPHN